jgi:hypothetical protein
MPPGDSIVPPPAMRETPMPVAPSERAVAM